MPYDNPYNRRIANEIHNINERYATLYDFSPVDGRDSGYAEGGSNAGVLFQMGNASKRDGENNMYNEDLHLPPQYFYGNSAEGMMGGNGFAEGSFRDTGIGHQMGASAVGQYEKGMGMSGGNLWTDIYHGFEDMGSDIGKATDYVFGSGKPEHFRVLGRMIGHKMKGMGMSGGSWWDSLKEGVSDVVGFLPELAIHAIGGENPAIKEIGGAILGNPDPYPRQGDSERIAGKGRGRPKGSGKSRSSQLISNNSDLLAMPAPVSLANGVPPNSQLRGAYGGAMPEPSTEVKKKILKAVEKKIKNVVSKKGGSNQADLGVMMQPSKIESILAKMGSTNLNMTDKRDEMKGGMPADKQRTMSTDKRKLRAELVRKIMKEKNMKMIEASSYIKKNGIPY